MKFVFWKAAVFGLLGLSFCMPSASAATCHIKRAAYLDVFPDGGMRPRVKVSLNGTEEYFLVDTAGIYSAVSPDTAKSLNLKTEHFKTNITHVVSGEVPDRIAFVDHMVIGHLPLPRMSLVVMTPGELSSDSEGLLSGELLHLFDLEINPAAGKLSLFLHNDCGDKIVYWTHGPRAALDFRMNQNSGEFASGFVRGGPDWHVVVPAKLDGEDVSVTIDTGASQSAIRYNDVEEMLSSKQMKKLKPLNHKNHPDPENTAYSYPFKTLDFDGVKVANPQVYIFPGSRSHVERLLDSKPQLILGEDVLSKLHIYIAYKDKRIYITPASSH